MSKITTTQVNQLLEAINQMRDSELIDELTYNKMLINASFEYANLLDFENASIILGIINPNYFDNDLIIQLQEDPKFYQICSELSKLFDLNINLSKIFVPNHPPAQA